MFSDIISPRNIHEWMSFFIYVCPGSCPKSLYKNRNSNGHDPDMVKQRISWSSVNDWEFLKADQELLKKSGSSPDRNRTCI